MVVFDCCIGGTVNQKNKCNKTANIDAAKQSTPIQTQAKLDIANIPSALKECCSINLGSFGVEVPYVSQFMITNKEIYKDLHSLEKEVLDFYFLKETMDKL